MSLSPPADWGDIPPPDVPPDWDDITLPEPVCDALPGEPLTPEHREYLAKSAITDEYLAQPHVGQHLRSVTTYQQVPEAFRWSVDEDAPSGILFGYPDPRTGWVTWQFRPDHPRNPDTKYVFPKGTGSPVALRSAPLATPPVGHTVVIIEGTKQALAGAAALAHDPSMMVMGIAGCHGGLVHGKLAPGIAHVIKGATRVVIIPDADASANPDVYAAMDRLGKAVRARLTKRRAVLFAQLHGSGGTDGLDDVLATIPVLQRPPFMLELFDDAIPSPADVRPSRRRADAEDDEAYTYFHPFAGGLRTKACAEAIMKMAPLAIDAESGVLHRFDADTGLYTADRNAGSQRGSAIVCEGLADLLGDDYRTQFVSSVTDIIQAQLYAQGKVIPEVPDTDGLLPVENGLLDMETGRLLPFSPDVFVTAKLSVPYDPAATCPEFDSWLPQATALADGSDQADILLDALTGLLDTAAGLRAPDRALYLYGEPRAGKGTLGNDILSAMVPRAFQTALSLSEMAENRPVQNAKLYRKLLNLSGETPEAAIHDFSTMKRALGGDAVPAELKYGKLWEFYCRAFMVFMGNDLPHFNDTSGSVGARLCPVFFTKSNVGQEDRGIGARLRAELSGILNRILAARTARVARGGQFLSPAPEALRAFADATNPVSEFMDERVKIAPASAWTATGTVVAEWAATKVELYEAYTSFTASVGRKPLARSRFLAAISRQPFSVREGRTPAEDGKRRVFGCRLLPPETSPGINMSTGNGHVDVAVPSSDFNREWSRATAKAIIGRVGVWEPPAAPHVTEPDTEPDTDGGTSDTDGGSPVTSEPSPTPPPTPSATVQNDQGTHPALARMGTEFWKLARERGTALPPIPARQTEFQNRCEQERRRAELSGLPAVVTLTDLARTLELPPEQARGYLRSVHEVLADHGVTLLERRLGAPDTLGKDAEYLGTFVSKGDKVALTKDAKAAGLAVTPAKRALAAAEKVVKKAQHALTMGEKRATKDNTIDLDALRTTVNEATDARDAKKAVLEHATHYATVAADRKADVEFLQFCRMGYAIALDPTRFKEGSHQ